MGGKKSTHTARKPVRPWDLFPGETLGASYLAEQAYCEKRVELWLGNPGSLVSVPREIEGEGPAALLQEELADIGSQFHQGVSERAPVVTPVEVRKRLAAGEQLILLESGLSGKHRTIPLGGVPDAVCFQGLDASCVIEYKVTDSNQLQTSHRVQLLVYGYLLEQEGFRVGDLLLACALVPRAHSEWIRSLPPSKIERFVNTVRAASHLLVQSEPSRQNWYQPDLEIHKGTHIWLRVFKYEHDTAERELQFFSDFWLGARPAKPTTKERKCAVCLYNSLNSCSAALAPYSGPSAEPR